MARRMALFLALATVGHTFDVDTGNALVEVVIPAAAPWLFEDVSTTGGDAPLVLRLTTILLNGLFDATAPYDDTAVGIYSRFDRRPPAERTNRNVNIAILYASHVILSDILPNRQPGIDALLTDNGFTPLSPGDFTTPVGIGREAAQKVLDGRRNDGMNAKGDFNRDRHFEPFKDTTGYSPVNTAYSLKDPSKWQPDMQRKGLGLYKIQQFVTPQWGITEPYSYPDPNAWQMPEPVDSNVQNFAGYKQQADEVLAASAALTEEHKLKAELFDNKINSLGFSSVFAGQVAGLSTLQFLQMDFLVNMAAFDAGIFVWNEKRRWDGVRPFSAIQHIYGDDTVQGWGGPGQGTVDLKASEWKALFEEADHPEYPSASTCFCNAHAQASRLYFGTDVLGFPTLFTAGSSRAEPGLTPAADAVYVFPTWTDFAEQCGQSRVWAGVHFQDAVDSSKNMCGMFGTLAFDFFSAHMNGTAPLREPAAPLPTPEFYKRGRGNGHGHGKGNGKGHSKGKGKGHSKH